MVPGIHNVYNSAMAFVVSQILGINPKISTSALSTYQNVGRRLELIGSKHGIVVVDDYAHNPWQIGAAFEALK